LGPGNLGLYVSANGSVRRDATFDVIKPARISIEPVRITVEYDYCFASLGIYQDF